MDKTKEIIEKECQICGKFFTTSNKRRLYCDDCKDNQTNLRRDMERNIKRSKRIYKKEPEPQEYVCDVCGKTFLTIPKLLFHVSRDSSHDGKVHIFCSRNHKDEYIREHSKCLYCGKPLKGNLFFNPRTQHANTRFCNQDCKDKFDYERQKILGNVKKCEFCGKEFIRSTGYFCCTDCYVNAAKQGWKSPAIKKRKAEKKEKENRSCKRIKRIMICNCCQKRTILEGTEKEIRSIHPEDWICENCRKKGRKKEQMKTVKKETKTIQNSTKDATQICATCRTSYTNCERMRSNFRIIPKGAKFNEKGILIECPKYR